MEDNILRIKKFSFPILIFSLMFLGLINKAGAAGASLFLFPASGSYNIGSDFKISVRLDSTGQSVNAAEGAINFDPNILSVLGMSKSDSIFNLWTTGPDFSNSLGNITFGGGTTDNFSGISGTILTITFHAKANGKSSVTFSSGSILASDGKGTNILSSLASGIYAIQPQTVNATNPEISYNYTPPSNAPKAPDIFSVTHPDHEKWYSDNNPKFSWNLPEGVTGVKMLYDQNPLSLPTKYYKEALSEKQMEIMDDGIWYFHLELCNKAGCGQASHFKVQIDTKKPEAFAINIEGGEKTTNPAPLITFNANDETSGIDYYQVKIGEDGWIENREGKYRLQNQDWGKHTVVVRAIDKAGNSTLSVAEVEILPLEAPRITDYPKESISGSYLTIAGMALPDHSLKIYIQNSGKIEENGTSSDKNGKWSYTYGQSLKTGVYTIWALTTDSKGAKSNPSDEISVIVDAPAFLKIGRLIIDYLTISIVLIVLILFIILAVIWGVETVKKKIRKLSKETGKAEGSLLTAFRHLEKEVEKEVAKMDGDPKLSKKEKKISESLKKALWSAEKYIGHEIKDISDELKKDRWIS